MKSIKKFGFVLVLAVATILSSCSSDSSGGGSSAGLGTLKAKIGSTNFTSIAQGTSAILASNGSYQNLSIGGGDATGKVMQLMILGPNIGVGTYPISETSDLPTTGVYTEVDLSNPTSATPWAAPYDGGGNSGSVIITSMTATNVQGTFSFTALNVSAGTGTKAITNGAFNINYTTN